MPHKFRIICEICEKMTDSGILITDKGLRLRMFCSEKCLEKKSKEQEDERKKPKCWLDTIFG